MKKNILIISLAIFIITVISFCVIDSFSYGEVVVIDFSYDYIIVDAVQEETNEENNEVVWLCHDFMTNYNDHNNDHSSNYNDSYSSENITQYLNGVIAEDNKNTVSDKKPVENDKYKVILSKKQLTDETYDISYMRSCLIHLLYFEACSCKTDDDVEEQRAIVSVVINRFNSNKYEHCYDVSDIIFFRYPDGAYAFSPTDNADRFWFRKEWKDSNEYKDFKNNYDQLAEKVDYVIQHGPTVPPYVLYFVSNSCYENSTYFKNNHKKYCVYDDTTFMTTEKP